MYINVTMVAYDGDNTVVYHHSDLAIRENDPIKPRHLVILFKSFRK